MLEAGSTVPRFLLDAVFTDTTVWIIQIIRPPANQLHIITTAQQWSMAVSIHTSGLCFESETYSMSPGLPAELEIIA